MVELKDTRLFEWNFRSTDLQKTGVSFVGCGWLSSSTKNRRRQKMKKLVELRDYQSASARENVRHFRTENCPICVRLRLIVVFQYLSSFSTGK